MSRIVLRSDYMQVEYGNAHVDLHSNYAALVFGGSKSYNIMVDSGGVHINGAKGTTNF